VHRGGGVGSMMQLQRCTSCGRAQYPPRELCAFCLADTLQWETHAGSGHVLAATELHHSHEPSFRARLPLRTGLVQLVAGPIVVCFLSDGCEPGTPVSIAASIDAGRTVLSATSEITAEAPPHAAGGAPFQ
jgi:uncharacterized OB-fold protein